MKRTRLIFMLVFLYLMIYTLPATVMAGYTPVGVPAYKSYATSSGPSPVILMVGDSRTMMCTYAQKGMSVRSNYCFCWVNGGNVKVIGKNGALTPYLGQMIRNYRKRCVVALNLGVNGNSSPRYNARRIIRQYRRWMKLFPDVHFYVVSVNPTAIWSGPYSNDNIKTVNRLLRAEFEPEGIYIDTYTMLIESGLITGTAPGMSDQLHYRSPASRIILKAVRKFVTKKEEQG